MSAIAGVYPGRRTCHNTPPHPQDTPSEVLGDGGCLGKLTGWLSLGHLVVKGTRISEMIMHFSLPLRPPFAGLLDRGLLGDITPEV